MSKLFRAILIDPERQTVTNIETSGAPSEMRHLISCRGMDNWRLCDHKTGWDYAWVDEDGLKAGKPIHAFKFSNSPNPVAGRCIIIGVDKETGADADIKMSRDFARRNIDWLGLILPEVAWDETELEGGGTWTRSIVTYSKVK